MKRAIIILAILAVVGGAVGGGWWYINENPEWWFWLQDEFGKIVSELGLKPAEGPAGLVASGFIEADEASVVTELGGRIVALHADEGDEVEEGQVVVQLDDSLLLAKVEQAEADLAVAEANLAQIKAGVRQETLDHAQAMLQQVKAAQDAAHVAWEDAQAMQKNPQELNLAILAARNQLTVLGLQEQRAQAMADSAQTSRELTDQVVGILEDFEPFVLQIPVNGTVIRKRIRLPVDLLPNARDNQALATYQSWEAWTGVEQAQAAKKGAADYLAELGKQKATPLTLQARTDAAKSQYEIAASAVAVAQAQVDGLKIGAMPEQIAAVEAQVEIARAALETFQVQLGKLTLKAPISGLVLERPVHVGEVAAPGVPLMTLADLDSLSLTIYVPEDQLGRVRLGQPVSVTVDAYPGRTFNGTVTLIASRAEFTPKNVQTREERVNMVFAVKVKLPNSDHALKPGMPADAAIMNDEP
jgi:multidrug efflux pump subunit AcrA (membrane-fusion protein)